MKVNNDLFFRHLPTKTDLDAYRAMEDSAISRSEYPYIHRWKSLISSRMRESGNELVFFTHLKYSEVSDIFPKLCHNFGRHAADCLYKGQWQVIKFQNLEDFWLLYNIHVCLFRFLTNSNGFTIIIPDNSISY